MTPDLIEIAATVARVEDNAGMPLTTEVLAEAIGHAIADAGYRLVPLTDLPTEAKARRSDPATSQAAALSVGDLNRKQRCVLTLIEAHPEGLTDRELVEANTARYAQLRSVGIDYPQQSRSGLRTRRAELVAAGLVEWTGETRRLASGRSAQVWRAV